MAKIPRQNTEISKQQKSSQITIQNFKPKQFPYFLCDEHEQEQEKEHHQHQQLFYPLEAAATHVNQIYHRLSTRKIETKI